MVSYPQNTEVSHVNVHSHFYEIYTLTDMSKLDSQQTSPFLNPLSVSAQLVLSERVMDLQSIYP